MRYEAPITDMPELFWTDDNGPHNTEKDWSARGKRVRMRTVHGLLHNRRPHIGSGCPGAPVDISCARRTHVLSDSTRDRSRTERSQNGQRYIDFVHESVGIISQSNITMKLIGKAVDKACPKAAPSGLLDCWPALLGPCQLEQLRCFIDRQCDFNTPRGVGQRPVLDRIRA